VSKETKRGEPWRSNAWTDLALVVPIFVAYHLGVVTLSVRNAADLVTAQLVDLADRSTLLYWAITLGIGMVLVGILVSLGRGKSFQMQRFVLVMVEGALYALLMGVAASYVVGKLTLTQGPPAIDLWTAVVMSLGAGFYEEIAFRVGLFGLGAMLIKALLRPSKARRALIVMAWAIVAAALFSAWHYVGPMADAFEPRSFVFRWVCGLAFTLIFALRGFAPAVWTHALYDIWVLALQ
jgi:hypothetical protein